ncbi:unnamed protein product [Adineta steineri]|uniref:G-protein coupled receptors family 1 profile domain-containing protein n=1 Tax=Adineta steineri TaxID=433720 RepID=A0A819DP20_9BILA|nr:unnamed protein product [Adineta steineri]CAF3832061.1 unnamed protein product [Adineta steineri]
MTSSTDADFSAYYAGLTFNISVVGGFIFLGLGVPFCYLQPGDYRIFDAIANIVLELIPLIFLSIFGMGIWKNLGRIRVQPATNVLVATNTHRSKDQQLTITLLAETVNYMLWGTPICILSMYREITQYETKSARQETIEEFLLAIFYYLTFIRPTTNFFIYLAVSKTFRKKAFQILFKQGQHRTVGHDVGR